MEKRKTSPSKSAQTAKEQDMIMVDHHYSDLPSDVQMLVKGYMMGRLEKAFNEKPPAA